MNKQFSKQHNQMKVGGDVVVISPNGGIIQSVAIPESSLDLKEIWLRTKTLFFPASQRSISGSGWSTVTFQSLSPTPMDPCPALRVWCRRWNSRSRFVSVSTGAQVKKSPTDRGTPKSASYAESRERARSKAKV
jgi:hypothetical protein